MTNETVIETARLRIRCHCDDDLADLVALVNDWEVAQWVGLMPHPYAEKDGREWIETVKARHATGRPHRFAIALKEDDHLIGGIGLDGASGDGSTEPALGYWLGQAYWGNGYAREAVAAIIGYGFDTLGLETIRAYTDPGNARSSGCCCTAAWCTLVKSPTRTDTPCRAASTIVPHLPIPVAQDLTGGRPNRWPDLIRWGRVRVFCAFRLTGAGLGCPPCSILPMKSIFGMTEVVEQRGWCCIENAPAGAKPATVIAQMV